MRGVCLCVPANAAVFLFAAATTAGLAEPPEIEFQ